MTQTIEKRKKQVEEFEAEMLSGRTFILHALGSESAIGYRPPSGYREHAQALKVLAIGSAMSDRQAQLLEGAVKAQTLYLEGHRIVAAAYRAVAKAVEAGYDDIIKKASPEPGRYSDWHSGYSIEDLIMVEYTLKAMERCYIAGAGGPGWVITELTEKYGVRVPDYGRGS